MPIWMIMMGLQVILFIFSGAWVLAWMHGKHDVYDEKLFESTRTYLNNREQKLAAESEGQSK